MFRRISKACDKHNQLTNNSDPSTLKHNKASKQKRSKSIFQMSNSGRLIGRLGTDEKQSPTSLTPPTTPEPMDLDIDIEQRNNWKTAVDPKSKKTYYYNTVSRKSTWDKPIELASKKERAEMKEKERKLKSFFREMEHNIMITLADGGLPGGFNTSTGKQTRTTTLSSTMSGTLQSAAPHKIFTAKARYRMTSSFEKTNMHEESPNKVTAFPDFNKNTTTTTSSRDNDNNCDMDIDQNTASQNNTNNTSDSTVVSVPSIATNLGKDGIIKCICAVLRAHLIESMIRKYTGSFRCSGAFDDCHGVTLSQSSDIASESSSPLVDPRLRAELSGKHDIMSLAVLYKGDDVPSLKEIIQFFTDIFTKSQMESDCIIMALIYIEKIIKKSHDWVRPTVLNWKSILLASIMMASKVWDDLSMINVDFANICASIRCPFSLKRINQLELSVLELLKYKVSISSSEYRKYCNFIESVHERLEVLRDRPDLEVKKMKPKTVCSSGWDELMIGCNAISEREGC